MGKLQEPERYNMNSKTTSKKKGTLRNVHYQGQEATLHYLGGYASLSTSSKDYLVTPKFLTSQRVYTYKPVEVPMEERRLVPRTTNPISERDWQEVITPYVITRNESTFDYSASQLGSPIALGDIVSLGNRVGTLVTLNDYYAELEAPAWSWDVQGQPYVSGMETVYAPWVAGIVLTRSEIRTPQPRKPVSNITSP